MKRINLTSIFVFSVTCITLVLAVIQFNLNKNLKNLPTFYIQSFYILVTLSFILSLLIFISARNALLISLISIKLLFFLVLGYSLQGYMQIKLGLYSGFLIEAGIRLAVPFNIAFCFLAIIAILYFQQPGPILGMKLFGLEFVSASFQDLLSFGLYLLMIALLSCGLKIILKKFYHEKTLNLQLNNNIYQLINANLGFQEYANISDAIATKKERERITSEIHDSAGYIFTNIIALMEVAISLGTKNKERLSEIHYEIKKQAKEGLKEIRRSLRLLRKAEKKEPQGIKALLKITKTFENATKVKIKLELGNSKWSYGYKIDKIIYRIVQEALTNSFLHGKATEIYIYFWENNNALNIYIKDNGRGADKIEKGIGLSSMEQRIDEVGGKLNIFYSMNGGFAISIMIPLEEKG